MNQLIPIFPLELVVYPGEELNLHIFEPRYKQLINDCAETKMSFGIPTVLAKKIAGWGTLVELTEIANVTEDGQMDIRTRGLTVFRISRLLKEYPGKLYSGAFIESPTVPAPAEAKSMRRLLVLVKKLHGLLNVKKKFSKPESELTSYDLAHHLGLALSQEYELLGMLEEHERRAYLESHLEQVLPVVAEMESLKEKVKLNGHFKRLPGFGL